MKMLWLTPEFQLRSRLRRDYLIWTGGLWVLRILKLLLEAVL